VSSKAKTSAGLLPFRFGDGSLEVLLAHMGGPFWAAKDDGAWSIVKGEYDDREEPYAAAVREFEEETGWPAPPGEPLELGEVRQSSGKRVIAWAIEGDFDPDRLLGNTFAIEWPRGSGARREFPEIDRVAWFDCDTARRKLVRGQAALIDALVARVGGDPTARHEGGAESG